MERFKWHGLTDRALKSLPDHCLLKHLQDASKPVFHRLMSAKHLVFVEESSIPQGSINEEA